MGFEEVFDTELRSPFLLIFFIENTFIELIIEEKCIKTNAV